MTIVRMLGLISAALVMVVGAGGATASATVPAVMSAPAEPIRVTDPEPSTVAAAPSPAASSTITLLTGDQVTLDVAADGTQTTEVPSAQDGSAFVEFGWRGDRYVVPSEAAPYLDGTLDVRLFNVSYLARAGFDDARSATLPVRVEGGTGTSALPGLRAADGLAKAYTSRVGDLLARQWRASVEAGTAPGKLPGVDRITLAAPESTVATPPRAIATQAGSSYHTLTVGSVDLDGKPGVVVGVVHSVDDIELGFFTAQTPGESEPLAFSVPEGTYSVEASVFTGPADDFSTRAAFVVEPEIDVRGDTAVTLDAREAVPYTAALDDPPADLDGYLRQDMLTFQRLGPAGNGAAVHASGDGAVGMIALRLVSAKVTGNQPLYATPTKRVRKGSFSFAAYTQLADKAIPATKPSYRLAFPYPDGIPRSLTHAVAKADLTTVHSTIHRSPYGAGGPFSLSPRVYLPWTQGALGIGGRVAPGERTDYWYSSTPDLAFWQVGFTSDDGDRRSGARRKIRPGQVIDEVWNKAPAVPSRAARYLNAAAGIGNSPDPVLSSPTAVICAACRQGDIAMAYLTNLADSDPTHRSDSSVSVAGSHVEFYRDGQLAFTSKVMSEGKRSPVALDLPMLPRPAQYRLRWEQTARGRYANVGSTTDWTFRSSPSDRTARLPDDVTCAPDRSRRCSFLPLLFPRYDLPLDLDGQAPAGAPFQLAFAVESQQHQAAPSRVTATVAVSYDDGATWTEPQPAARQGDGTFAAPITHPATGTYVSLRVQAQDGDGNTVDQTVLRAYQLSAAKEQ